MSEAERFVAWFCILTIAIAVFFQQIRIAELRLSMVKLEERHNQNELLFSEMASSSLSHEDEIECIQARTDLLMAASRGGWRVAEKIIRSGRLETCRSNTMKTVMAGP